MIVHQTKYLAFDEEPQTGKTKVWTVLSRSQNAPLGRIAWYGPWRQYVFEPGLETLFNPGCLDDIGGFMRREMAKRKDVTAP